MKNKFLKLYSGNKDIVKNFSYLAILQVFNLAVPLITLPYLLTVLGKENYGLIVFSQTLVSYFLILINFGFDIIATKEVSLHRDDKKKLSEVVSSVFIVKGIFFIISFVILLTLLPLFSDERLKYLLIFMMYLCFYEWIFPVWYFQGKEEMKYITIVNMISRVIFLILIFFVVKNEQDFLKVPIINGTGCFFAGLVSIWLVFKKDGIKFKFQKISVLKKYVIESFPIFFGNIAGKIKILSNKAILGSFVGMEILAVYDVADKIKDLFIYFLQIIVSVLFPNVVKSKNGNLVRKIIKIIFYSSILIFLLTSLMIYFTTKYYFNSDFDVLYIFLFLGLLIILQPLSYMIGVTVLLVNDLKKEYTLSLYLSVLFYILLNLSFYLFGQITVYSVSLTLLLSVLFELIVRILISKKNKLIKWIF
ncbi:oligosaccharide flippase family protein [Polaribacter butkevichii]|uniref:Flippase n=1 Tax=Polaribacter butkevichii TaxID=218490 RepID=A0A2P6CB08_9FLAO|nr:oligosaccharide flippase family protein [Polaribacter butkevichii]PQJ72081.1 hypothetical protein BTO14_01915 [Polaribacter butkevichii]